MFGLNTRELFSPDIMTEGDLKYVRLQLISQVKKKGNCQITEPLSWRVFEPAWLVIRNINMLAVLPQQMIHGQYV